MSSRNVTIGEILEGGGAFKTGPFGTALKAAEYTSEGVPVISVGEVGQGDLNLRADTPRVDSSVTERLSEYLLNSGDIVFARKGAVDRSAWVKPIEDGWFLGSDGLRLRLPETVESRFVAYQLRLPSVREWILQHASGSTMLSLNQGTVARIPLLLPALSEQRAIAEVLGALDDKIAANSKLSTTIHEVLETETLVMWFGSGGIGDSSILDFVDVNPSMPRPTEAEPIYVDMRKLPESGSGISDWERRPAKGGARFQLGDTLLARITPCLENRKTGYVDFLAQGAVGIGSTEFIVLRTKDGYASPISYFLATNERFRDFAIRHMVGTSGRQRVAASDIASYRLPRPDEAWIRDFGERADLQFRFLKSLRDENRTLAATRDALLPQLMSGKLRVRDAERIVEKAL